MNKNKNIVLIAGAAAILLSVVILLFAFVRNYPEYRSKTLFNKAFLSTKKAMAELSTEDTAFGLPNTSGATANIKFCKAFAAKVGAVEPIDCSKEFKFKTRDGVYWSVPPILPKNIFGQFLIDTHGGIDKTSKSNPNCNFDSLNCPNPDRFRFFVKSDGMVIPFDPLERSYAGQNMCTKTQKFEDGNCVEVVPKCKKITEYLYGGRCVKSVCPKGLIFHMRACYPKGHVPRYKLSEIIQLIFE